MRAKLGCLVLAFSAWGQQPQAPAPQFEVASVRPSAPDARGTVIRPGPGGGVSITNMTLKELMVIAYRIQPFQISGGPAWLNTAHYDIVAKPEAKPKPIEIPLMLQNLMADRFQLTLHRESKELPVYALVLARKDGKLGPSLTERKEGTCTPPDPNKPSPPPEPGKTRTFDCGGMISGRGRLRAGGFPIGDITPMLSRQLGRIVIDKTGLVGNFDVNLEWTPDSAAAMPLASDAPKPPMADLAGPSISTAIQEQLGLKLESQKGSVEIFVIDRAEKPSEN